MNFRDGYLVAGQPLGALPQDVTLTADDTTIILSQQTALIRLYSDSTTAANRTFLLPPGWIIGQDLTICFMSTGSTTAQLQDSGNVALSAAWTPLVNDTLRLMWNGTTWVEISRSDN